MTALLLSIVLLILVAGILQTKKQSSSPIDVHKTTTTPSLIPIKVSQKNYRNRRNG